MQYILNIETFGKYVHYYLNNVYIGMLVFDKGELSDHRAIIRKNKLNITDDNLYDSLKISLYGLLNHYLSERLFISKDKIEIEKTNIVNANNDILKYAADNAQNIS